MKAVILIILYVNGFRTTWANIKISSASICKPTGLTGFPPAALIPDTTPLYTAQYNVSSATQCAFRANLAHANGYSYQDAVCTIYDPDQAYYHETMFWTTPQFPPLDSLEEVARNKETYSVPPRAAWAGIPAAAGNAVDGSLYYRNAFLTLYSMPWWMVDIGELRTIHQVQILGRLECCQDAFKGAEIRIGDKLLETGDFSSYTLMSIYKGPNTAANGILECSNHHKGIIGRYISIKLVTGSVDLTLLEVKVYALKK